MTSNQNQRSDREPLYDIAQETGISFEVFTRIARWKRSAAVELVGSGGLAVPGARRTVQRLGRLLRATQRIGTR